MVVDDDAVMRIDLAVSLVCYSSRLVAFAIRSILVYRSIPRLWPLLLLYLIYIYTDRGPEHGGRMSPWFRGTKFWRLFAEYYPAS